MGTTCMGFEVNLNPSIVGSHEEFDLSTRLFFYSLVIKRQNLTEKSAPQLPLLSHFYSIQVKYIFSILFFFEFVLVFNCVCNELELELELATWIVSQRVFYSRFPPK